MTIEYDFGPGRTYATPQAALNACQAANEIGAVPQNFTEINRLRGYGDAVYNGAGGEPPLRLAHGTTGRTLLPTAAFPLIIDRDGTSEIWLDDDQAAHCLVGANAAGSTCVSNVWIDGIKVRSHVGDGSGYGIVVNPDQTGAGTASNWRVTDVEGDCDYGVIVPGCMEKLAVKNCELKHEGPTGAAIFCDGSGAGVFSAFSGIFNATGNAIRSIGGSAIQLYTGTAAVKITHNSFATFADCLNLLPDAAATYVCLLEQWNNVHRGGDVLIDLAAGYLSYNIGSSDANCYYSPINGLGCVTLFAKDGTNYSLADWQAFTGEDQNSIEADPLFTQPGEDLTLQALSPCRRTGRHDSETGLEGNARTLPIIAMGAYQPDGVTEDVSLIAVVGTDG